MSPERTHAQIWGSLKLRVFKVITAIELLFASAYVSHLVGWVMLLVACVLLGTSVGSVGLPADAVGGLRQHRQSARLRAMAATELHRLPRTGVEEALEALRDALGSDRLLTGADVLSQHAHDESFHPEARPDAVVWPRSIDECARARPRRRPPTGFRSSRSAPARRWRVTSPRSPAASASTCER